MRNPNRIEPLMELITKVWSEYPDWRFGQLIVNVLGTDPFYLEDNITFELFLQALEIYK